MKTTLPPDLPPTSASLVRALRLAGPGGLELDADELAVMLGMSRETVYLRIRELLASDSIVQMRTSHGTRLYLSDFVEVGA